MRWQRNPLLIPSTTETGATYTRLSCYSPPCLFIHHFSSIQLCSSMSMLEQKKGINFRTWDTTQPKSLGKIAQIFSLKIHWKKYQKKSSSIALWRFFWKVRKKQMSSMCQWAYHSSMLIAISLLSISFSMQHWIQSKWDRKAFECDLLSMG